MTPHALPTLILALVVSGYWLCVARMVWRVRRRTKGVRGVLVPVQARERVMGALWMPIVAAWIALPWIALAKPGSALLWPALPDRVLTHGAFLLLRFVAAGAAVAGWLGSIACWRHMGKHWRMAVDVTQGRLFVDGPFRVVRHPIYALSMLLMLCSVVILPAVVLLSAAALHIVLMHIKARNEEAFLAQQHGAEYVAYCARTGRFVPRRGLRATAS